MTERFAVDPPIGESAAMPRRWTDQQLAAIERRRGDLLLDAGAGSGKTSVLVERFARSVIDDGVEVGAILVITFTEKAAAELRDRLRARLAQLGALDAARATEGAFISTIHGFCARVLRAGALAAGLDPEFEVLDEVAAARVSAAALDHALTEVAARDSRLVELVAAYGAGPLRAAIAGVYEQLRSAGERSPRLPPLTPPADDGAERLRAAATATLAELSAVPDPGARVLDAIGRVRYGLQAAQRGAAEVWPGSLWRAALRNGAAALSTDACSEYREALAALRAAAGAIAAIPVRDVLDQLLHAYTTEYDAAKRRRSALDFEDLELGASALLAGDEALRERYAERFAAIMVDELQDTNAVQLQLIESIARDNLFTVGDAQQSIYGFRHADVELFAQRGRALGQAGARLTLATNFRSSPEILRAINHGFADALGDAFIELRPGRDPGSSEPPRPRTELLLVDKGADWELEGMAAPWRLAEARALALRLRELLEAGAAAGEIVVLLRAMTDVRVYERALEREGLPTYVIGGRGYWDHPQVVDLVCYLRALDNPLDDEALYGVLASPFVGASVDALVLVSDAVRRTGAPPWSLLSSADDALTGLSDDDRRRLAAFADWFATERARAARCEIAELIESALIVSGYDLAMLRLPGGVRRLANVRKLMRLAREHELEYGPGLQPFVAALARRAAGGPGAREGEAPVEGEGLDAIRLMTIHRAKGLEFDTVVVADLGRSVRPRSELVRVGADGRLGLRLSRPGVGERESALAYAELGREAQAAADREERRLFYVAMTRARERLLLSGAAKFSGWLDGSGRVGGGPIAWIAPAFVDGLAEAVADGGGERDTGGARVTVRIGHPDDDSTPAPVPGTQVLEPAPAVPEPPAQAPRPRTPAVTALSYSALQEYHRCGYRFYATRVLGLPSVSEAVPDDPPAPRSGADRGVLVHALLQRLRFRHPLAPSAASVAAAAARAGIEPAPGPAESDELIALVRRFTSSELCGRLGRATSVRREQRFTFALSDGAFVTGALDVLAREPGGRSLIVDYKTDRLGGRDPVQLAGGYEIQRLVYAIAALRAGADSVQIAHCFLEAPDVPVLAEFDAERRPELDATLERFAAGVIAGRFEVSPEPRRGLCAGCPAQGGLCSWPESMTRRAAADTLF